MQGVSIKGRLQTLPNWDSKDPPVTACVPTANIAMLGLACVCIKLVSIVTPPGWINNTQKLLFSRKELFLNYFAPSRYPLFCASKRGNGSPTSGASSEVALRPNGPT